MNTSNVIEVDFPVNKERKGYENEEINPQSAWDDPLQNLIQLGNWYSLPYPVWFQLHCMLDSRTRLLDYIGRMTLGFRSKKTKLYRVATPWPGHGKIAGLLGVSSAENVSTIRRQFERSGMIIVWKDKDGKREWVGINPVLFHIPPIVTRFLGKYAGKYHYMDEQWIDRVKAEYDTATFNILKVNLLKFKGSTIECYRLTFKSLKVDVKGQLYFFCNSSKVPQQVKSLKIVFKRKDRKIDNKESKSIDQLPSAKENSTPAQDDQSSASCKNDQSSTPAQDGGCGLPPKDLNDTPAPEPAHQAPGDRQTQMAEHLMVAHKARYRLAEVSRKDERYGFPKAAKALLEHSGVQRYWKFSDEGLGKGYVKFIGQLAKEKGWKNEPHGGTYSSGDFIEEFVERNEAILYQKQRERWREEERNRIEREKRQEERRRKLEEKFKKADQEWQRGGRPCFGDPMKKEWCKHCKETTYDEYYVKCLFDRGRGGSKELTTRYKYDNFLESNQLN